MKGISFFTFVFALVGAQKTWEEGNSSQRACLSLQKQFGPDIVQFSSGPSFQQTLNRTWNLVNAQLVPTCIVFPRNTFMVQSTMQAIFANEAHYAVQSGGHTAMKGWNNVQDGLLMSFSNMKNATYDTVTDTITLQPGIRWGEVASVLEPLGVAPVGGRQGDVGTGLLLGGGLSFLSPAYGFAADSIKEIDVVLANGSLVTANAGECKDLFRAIKGGGSRFGIVTRFELYAVHTGTKENKEWIGGIISYPRNSTEATLKAFAHYVRDVSDPRAVALYTSLVTSNDTQTVVYAFYNGTELPQHIFGELLSIPGAIANITHLSYFDIANFLPPGNDIGSGQRFGASAVHGNELELLDTYRLWSNYTSIFKHNYAAMVLAFTPVLIPQIQAGRARGGNAIDPPLINYAATQISEIHFPGNAEGPVTDDEAKLELLTRLRPGNLPLFLNECDRRQNIYESYGDYDFLKRTYAKYDPTRHGSLSTLFIINYSQGPVGL